jgi:hypothetical protein
LQFHIALGVLDNMSRKILDASVAEQDVTTARAHLREMAGLLGFWAAEQES